MVDMSSGGRFLKSMEEMSSVSRFHEEHGEAGSMRSMEEMSRVRRFHKEHGGNEQGKQVP